ncbi:MAG: sensor histidine kinase [Haliea sp.]|nr:MAG: sensor histidine kinase [Haliea sp.]
MLVLACAAAGCASDTDGTAAHLVQAQLLSVAGSGFTPPPAQVADAALPASGWQGIGLPYVARRDIRALSGAGRTLTDWYRLDLSGLPASAETSAEPVHLYIPRWKTIGQLAIYGDGALLYQSEGSVVHNGYNHPLLLRLNGAAGMPAPATVLLRIDRLQASGSALSTVWVGTAQQLVWRYQVRAFLQNQLPFVGVSAFLALGLFSLAVWCKRRQESLYLLFFITSAAAFVRMQHYYIGGNLLPLSDAWMQWITVSSLMWLIVLVNSFMERVHKRPLRWLTPCLIGVTVTCNVLTLPDLVDKVPNLVLVTPQLYLLMLPFAVLISADALLNALRTRLREVWLMAGWFVATIALSAYDLALQNNWVSPEGVYTNPYGVIGLFVMFGYIMFRRYVGAIDEAEQLNANLANSLRDREAELAVSYERMSQIERSQTLSNERQRLTQDMHDGLGSSLVSALRGVEGGRLNEADVAGILKGCIDDLKLTIDSMEPVEADLLLLLATVRFRLGPRLAAAGIALRWEVTDVPALDWLDPRNALHILRILQEAFANILKHTQASEIRVSTAVESKDGAVGVTVTICDNGQGFVLDTALRSGGKGLHNQLRRASSIGARLHWDSDGSATRLHLWLPEKRSPA